MASSLTESVARRVHYLRKRKGFSQDDLAEKLTNFGMPVDRSQVARLETGRRPVGLDEMVKLAFVLDVAPVHLLVDPDGKDEETLTPIPGAELKPWEARAWIRGQMPMLFQDPRSYFMNVPTEELEAFKQGSTELAGESTESANGATRAPAAK